MAEEVRKNVKDNQTLLENEIAGGIQDLKEKSISGMQRKKILSNRLIDLQKKEDLKNGPARKYQVLSELEIEMERKASEYAALYTAWKKNRFSVVSMDIREKWLFGQAQPVLLKPQRESFVRPFIFAIGLMSASNALIANFVFGEIGLNNIPTFI